MELGAELSFEKSLADCWHMPQLSKVPRLRAGSWADESEAGFVQRELRKHSSHMRPYAAIQDGFVSCIEILIAVEWIRFLEFSEQLPMSVWVLFGPRGSHDPVIPHQHQPPSPSAAASPAHPPNHHHEH